MSEALVSYAQEGAIGLVTLDDGKANALSPALLDDFAAALDEAEANAKAIVIAGRAGRFCAGYDLKVMMSGKDAAAALVAKGAELMARLYVLPRPVVIACTGHAMAGGALLLLCGDRRIGVDGPFKIGLNEVQIGIPLPSFGLDLVRDRLDPRAWASATMCSDIFDPQKAREVGFLDDLAQADSLHGAALEQASALAALSTDAYGKTKRGLRQKTAEKMVAEVHADLAALLG